jgi:hypothetical protein
MRQGAADLIPRDKHVSDGQMPDGAGGWRLQVPTGRLMTLMI